MTVCITQLGRLQATLEHKGIILKLEIREGHCSVKTQTNKIVNKITGKISHGRERRTEKDLHS